MDGGGEGGLGQAAQRQREQAGKGLHGVEQVHVGQAERLPSEARADVQQDEAADE
jgi:hypothetical protein